MFIQWRSPKQFRRQDSFDLGFIRAWHTGGDKVINQVFNLPVSAYSYTTIPPVLVLDQIFNIPIKNYTYSAIAPQFLINFTFNLPEKQYTYTALAPELVLDLFFGLPVKAYTYTPIVPDFSIDFRFKLPLTQYVLNYGNIVLLGAQRAGLLFDANDLDTTPPRELTAEHQRWLINNIEILKSVLQYGVTGTFTTDDGRMLVIRNGIVEQIYEP